MLGILLGAGLFFAAVKFPVVGLEREGRLCLAFTAAAIIFWIFKVMDSNFVAGLYLVLLVSFKVGDATDIFAAWTDGVVWLVIGSFLIAQAVVDSGICKRFTYIFILRFVRSFSGVIISIFVLSVILALLIPNPWPRAFILIGVVKEISASAKLTPKDTAAVGFSVFAASIPTCFIFQTGAASMNQLVLSFSGLSLSWIEWFKIMSVPGIALTVVYCLLILLLFPSQEVFALDKDFITQKLEAMGPISQREKKTLLWLAAAIILWLTDSIHGVHVSWSTMGIAMLMAMPIVGELTDSKSWKAVPVGTVIYLTAAVAIGRVGRTSGMTSWITENILPSRFPDNIWALVLTVSVMCMFLHIFLGSTIAANSVIIPSMLLSTASTDLSPLCCVMVCYLSVFGQYIFSYQHINILMGIGESGMYSEKDSMKLALPLTLCVPLVILTTALPWWSFLGVLR